MGAIGAGRAHAMVRRRKGPPARGDRYSGPKKCESVGRFLRLLASRGPVSRISPGSDRGPLGAASTKAHPGVTMTERFVIRPDREGFSVIDIWVGETAIIAMTPQSGMPETDAKHIAELLNRRAANGDRTVLA